MPILVRSTNSRLEARHLLGNAATPANVNAIVRLLNNNSVPYYKVRAAAFRVRNTHRNRLRRAIRRNIGQRRAERVLTSPAGMLHSPLPLNMIREIARRLEARRRH